MSQKEQAENVCYKLGLAVLCTMTIANSSGAVAPTRFEMEQAATWARARFEGKTDASKPRSGLVVLANNDPVIRNNRQGRPLNISGKTFTRGLYCHAVSKVVVKLPGAAKRLEAVVGVDSNEQTTGGRGSVVFSVTAKGRELFRSPVMHEGMAGIPVAVDLAGAAELTLDVGDAGDGIGWDQSDWADARVTLQSGEEVWLGDLPILEGEASPISTDPPFSFTYDAEPSSDLLSRSRLTRTSKKIDKNRTSHSSVWLDPESGLEVRMEAVVYSDFPTSEWTVYLKNTGKTDSGVISAFNGVDITLARGAEGEFTLNHNTGSPCLPIDFQPHRTLLPKGFSKRITTSGGRPTNSDLPYFNIEQPGEGTIVVIGWPGQWAADFARDGSNGLRVTSGQEQVNLRLHPGEEIRGPLVVVQHWQGERTRAQNIWRQWMLAHNTPHPGGKLPPLHMAACSSHQYAEMINTDTDKQIMFVDRYLEEKLPLDYWWMDAGWYVNASGWPNTGTWEVDTKRFPKGLREITDHAHGRGVKSIVWFEPERVTPGTWLYENHPEWLLGRDGEQKLLNLGNPDARKWLTDHVDGLLVSQGIDLYRQDFNIDPLGHWQMGDTPDRQGITENHHVTGYLAYWDELRRRHPDMLIDSCASGGRRNDIETLRRAVPLLRSDYLLEPTSQQNHTYGLASWIPLYGTGVNQFESYSFRSTQCPFINACYDMRNKDADWDTARRLVGDWKRVTPYYLGDFYPLTPYSPEDNVWMGWQFDRSDLGEGMVQVFRRPGCIYESARLKLNGLEEGAQYELTDVDSGSKTKMSGKQLAEEGVRVELPTQPQSAFILYRRIK